MRRHKGKILRGNQNTARNESTNFSSLAQSEQLLGDDLAWEQEHRKKLEFLNAMVVHNHSGVLGQQNPQQQVHSINTVNEPNHFGVLGQQNPQQQVYSNNMVNESTHFRDLGQQNHQMQEMSDMENPWKKQLWGDDPDRPLINTVDGRNYSRVLGQQKLQQQVDLNNMVNESTHFRFLGQQNPQQQKMSDLQNPLPLSCASSFINPASPLMGTRQKDIQVNPEASSSQSTATVVLQKESKVKQITGPMNFGIELLYSKTHNNIELHTQQGAGKLSNIGSPVIHHMTTTLELTIIDMEEFSEQSVQCFVEAVYTGSLPSITKGIFRDLNKIVHAFKVDWLQNSCFAIFRDFSFTDTKPGNQLSYADLCFLFDEAAFVLSKLKQENFMDEALNKIKGTGTKQEFVTRYLIDNDLEKVPCHQLDMVIKLVGDDVELIVQHVREKLLVRLGLEGAVISPNFKYLLQNCDLSHCSKRNPQLIEQLFDILQEVATNEDLKWVLRLHRKLASL